jgi:hypothetical protein
MATNSFEVAWTSYRSAIQDLYEASVEDIATTPGFRLRQPAEERVAAALEASDALTGVLRDDVESQDGDRQEIAIVRLLAAATIDLSIAYDLVPYEPELNPELWDGPVLTATLAEALVVLDSASDDVFRRLIIAGGAPMGADELKQQLERSVNAATQSILSDSSSAAVSTVSILLGGAAGHLRHALNLPIDNIFAKLNHSVRRVGRFIHNAIRKVIATLDGVADNMREEIGEWVGDRAEELGAGPFERWLARRYNAEAMMGQLHQEIKVVTVTSELQLVTLAQGASELDILAAKFHSQMKFARRVAWLVCHARRFLHVVAPWGDIAVIAGAVVATGGVVALGDDYLDGPDGGGLPRLRVIRGVMPIAQEAL